ncbi:PREDICTED: zinc transporter 5 [Theobroma cacao]|uniref:Zinc transporter 5 n=1 Tax=Theobroma cacao TaxID=3641 RepID=A0AB32WDA8_THECC|nr:PREDICTED: zinc transporter 5 [Theobroma cacao]
MADHHHHHHRPNRLSLPPRATAFTTPTTATSPRSHPLYSYPSITTPTPTPSKHRLSLQSSKAYSSSHPQKKSSFSFLLLLLSLRSLYSLLPFLRSSPPSFSLFPFSFLLSFLSFLLSLSFSLFSNKPPRHHPIFSLSSLSKTQLKLLLSKSFLLSIIFLLRFQALRYCGTAAMILAELSGNLAGRLFSRTDTPKIRSFFSSRFIGFCFLFIGLMLLSLSWDRVDCFPLNKSGFSIYPREGCVRVWPMLLPFLSGLLGCYEKVSMNWGSIRQLGRKRVRLISLFFSTVMLFVPAVVSFFVYESEGGGGGNVSVENLVWPLVNTVVFGVLLSENYSDDHHKLVNPKDFQREFVVTFACTVVLELFYFDELSLLGLLLCGLLLYFAVRELDPDYWSYLELGMESSESFSMSIMKPIRHILSERKSRKIALFLLINTGYMVVEFVAGFMSNSLGLISDACHMLFDCAALAIGLYASYISRLPANNQFNYGRGRFEILSGYANAVFLVLVGALIVLESFERILDPQEISTNSLLTVSIGGLVVNVVGLIFFHEEHHHAHGGSCSHSHSHSHFYSNDHHHQHSHDHESHVEHHNFINVSDGCQGSCSGHEHNHINQHGSNNCHAEDHDIHTECHDHHDHAHDQAYHDWYHNDHHDHGHQHDHAHSHDCAHYHDHHDHRHQYDHKDNHHEHGAGLHSHTHYSESKIHLSLAYSGSKQSQLLSEGKEPQKHQHHHIDHNMEGIFLHVLADTMGSVGVVVSTLLIKYKGWLVADPACSIFISVLIISSVFPLLRNSADILLQRVPRAQEQGLKKAISDVMKTKGVIRIQNLHVWSFTTMDIVGTIHLHISAETDKAATKAQVSHILHDAGIKDLTLQVECVE